MAKVPLKSVLKECKRRGIKFAFTGYEEPWANLYNDLLEKVYNSVHNACDDLEKAVKGGNAIIGRANKRASYEVVKIVQEYQKELKESVRRLVKSLLAMRSRVQRVKDPDISYKLRNYK